MSVRIITGDARLVLPQLEGEVVITDPVWPNAPAGLIPGSERPWELLRETIAVVPASVRRIVIVMRTDCDPRILDAVPRRWPYFNTVWLPYALPNYIGRVLGGNEVAYVFGQPVKSAEGRRVIPSQCTTKAQPTRKNFHPCSRSPEHMRFLVKWFSDPGETILDPFAGSGTVCLAADQLQRDAIGVEIDPEYAEKARRRIEDDATLIR